MSDLNENELEDLFREAAEKYPLRTDHGGWDEVLNTLDGDESAPVVPFYFSFPGINGLETGITPIVHFRLNEEIVRRIN